MTKSGVYKITNITNGKFYIGSSKDIEQRIWEHKQKLRTNEHRNPILQNSWNHYGEDKFKFEILEECENYLDREQYYLDTFQPYKGTGYNINPSATGGDWFTHHPNKELLREKMKVLNGGENNGMFGKTHSDETKKELKEKAKGRYTLDWFVEKYGNELGTTKYMNRKNKLSSRKINYVYDNGLKGTKRSVTKTTAKKISVGKKALAGRKDELKKDIEDNILTMKQIAEKYNVSTAAIKYNKKKFRQ